MLRIHKCAGKKSNQPTLQEEEETEKEEDEEEEEEGEESECTSYHQQAHTETVTDMNCDNAINISWLEHTGNVTCLFLRITWLLRSN